MKTSVKSRLSDVEKHFDIEGQTAFCNRTGIAADTYQRLINGDDVRQSTVKRVCDTLGVNFKWLMHGEGKMLTVQKSEEANPWKEALVLELKEEVTYLREALKLALSGKPNFLKALELAGAKIIPFKGKSVAHSGGNAA